MTTKAGSFWFPTRSGIIFDLDAPRADMVRWDDVAEALAKLCRFNGHCEGHYSVAEHSVRVGALLPPKRAIYGLLHDAHEAYLGDLIAPLKELLRADTDAYDKIERRIDNVIWEAAGLPPPNGSLATAIKRADRVMLATERRDLVQEGDIPRPWTRIEGVKPAPGPIDGLPWEDAKTAWLRHFELWAPRPAAGIEEGRAATR